LAYPDIERLDLTFENVNKDFKLLETLQNEQQDSLVELASSHTILNQTVINLQDIQHTDKLEVLYKIDDINHRQAEVDKLKTDLERQQKELNITMVNLENLVNSFNDRIIQSENIANYCKDRVEYCENRVKYCEDLCIETNNQMTLFNNATTSLTNQMLEVDTTLTRNTNISLQTREDIRDFRDAYDLLKKQLDATLLAAQRGDLIEIVVYNRVSQDQLDGLIMMYPNMIQQENYTRYDYSGLKFQGRWNLITFRHAQFANLTSISPLTRFYNCDMQHCNFQNNNLAGVAFVNCDLGNADFSNCSFSKATFNGCNVNDANFTNCDLTECYIATTDFTYSITTGASFPPPFSDEDPAEYSESDEDGFSNGSEDIEDPSPENPPIGQ
jgi:soluble cytochrome b562